MFASVKKTRYDAKKKTFGYKEQSEEKRQVFLKEISTYTLKQLIYIDEAGLDDNESYGYGWSKKGKRCFARKFGNRKGRINFIAGLTSGKLIAPFIFEGYCDRIVFDTYVENCLVPVISVGDIVIADNAAFHKSKRAKDLIADKGGKLIYLPPYSPDLNPIEHRWFPIKNEIRKSLDDGITLEQATILAFNKYV